MPRYFNTAGPCEPDRHYMVPAVERLPEARPLIEQLGYFVLHAPRQSGKTTTLRALAKQLTAEGTYAALHFSCEGGEPAQDDYAAAERVVVGAILHRAEISLPLELRPPPVPAAPPLRVLLSTLALWAQSCPRPLVLLFDEIDALQGEGLRTVLRQLREGFPDRPRFFPASVVLCGLRDVRDYKAASGGDPQRFGTSSPFNVKVESLRFGDFTEAEIQSLYHQHTEDTGQVFTDQAVRHAFELAQGQPWLTNALAREVIEKMAVRGPITEVHIEEAKERLILARQTHLDSLVARLMEPRVRRILSPMLEGGFAETLDITFDDDVSYVRDLGLIREKPIRVANPIYREVMVRVLASAAEQQMTIDPRSFVLPDGRLDLPKLLDEFAAFWTEHGEILTSRLPYHEVAPQLVLMAFLQRIVNGGGYVDREYGIGRGRIDLLVRWPYTDTAGKRVWQREALELKTWADKKADPLAQGLKQLENYLDRLGLQEGVLVLFDRRSKGVPFEERGRFEEASTAKGYRVTVLRG
jgi:hypothetical protein